MMMETTEARVNWEAWQEIKCPMTASGTCLSICEAWCVCKYGGEVSAPLLAYLNRGRYEAHKP
jgi:hypothetical protein